MMNVCLACHNQNYVDAFLQAVRRAARSLPREVRQSRAGADGAGQASAAPGGVLNKIDFIWYEIWHHEGRRARHGVSMMGPDITHWHGTYEVAKHFYSEFIPELQELADDNIHRDEDPARRKRPPQSLQAKLDEVLNSDNHKWYLNKTDPASWPSARRSKKSSRHATRRSRLTDGVFAGRV
jgi:hydroxylamine dehydrogenase